MSILRGIAQTKISPTIITFYYPFFDTSASCIYVLLITGTIMTTPKILCGIKSQNADDLHKQLAIWGKYYSLHNFPEALYTISTPPKAEKIISIYLEVLLTFIIYNLC